MSGYHGDIRLGDTIDLKFTTVSTAGAPTTLAGSPVVSAYPGNSTTQLTAGITLTVDFDAVTGLHNVRVVASSGNGYATATNYALVVTTGTVGGTSIAGYEIGSFSIENRSGLMPTTAARTLDVTATGEAGIDWGNVGSPTTTVGLTNTTVGTVTTTTTATNVTTVNGLAANVITAASIAADAIGASELAADAVTEIQSGLATAAALAIVDGIVDDILVDTAEIGVAGAGLTNINLPNQTMDITGNITGNLSGSVGSVTGSVGSVSGNVGGNVGGSVGSVTAAVTVGAMNAAALKDFFDTDSTTTAGAAVAGSVVKEIVDNSGGVSTADIADAVWDEVIDDDSHNVTGSAGRRVRQIAFGLNVRKS